eukprot:SAG22_NODE_1664_length_3864_cov_1.637716_6_plen_53_part_01
MAALAGTTDEKYSQLLREKEQLLREKEQLHAENVELARQMEASGPAAAEAAAA